MPREHNLEMKVGIFVVLAIVCLVAFIFSISDFSVFKGGNVYHVTFHYANGLKKSAPVRIAGVDAGHVRGIQTYFDRDQGRIMVAVEAWVSNEIAIPEDSAFEVNQLGLLGEKYLEILPGVATDFIRSDSIVAGTDPVSMETIMKQISGLGGKIETALNGLNNGILTGENKQALAATLANVAAVTEKINKGEGTVGKLLSDPSFYNNLEEFSVDVKTNPWKLFYRPKGKK